MPSGRERLSDGSYPPRQCFRRFQAVLCYTSRPRAVSQGAVTLEDWGRLAKQVR